MICPISYSFPAEKIVPYISFKTEHTANHQYQFTDEDEYLAHYRKAFFGTTQKRAGWDCLRHYEILSQGVIPHFKNLENLPPKTMVHFPKQLVLELNTKYYSKTLEEIYKESSSIVYNDLDSLLDYTKENLTTEKSVEYILKMLKKESAKEILLLTNMVPPETDYLFSMITHGLLRKFKHSIDCFPDFDYHYKDYPKEKCSNLYGRGFNYTRLLSEEFKTTRTKAQIEKKIENHFYDCIFLYMNEYSDELVPFNINKFYKNDEVAVICGRDCDAKKDSTGGWTTSSIHNCDLKQLKDIQTVFIRELAYD